MRKNILYSMVLVSFGHVLHFRYYQNEISKKVKMAPLGCWLTSFVWLWYGTMGLRTLWSRIGLLKFDKLLWKLPTDTELLPLPVSVPLYLFLYVHCVAYLYAGVGNQVNHQNLDPSLLPKTLWHQTTPKYAFSIM